MWIETNGYLIHIDTLFYIVKRGEYTIKFSCTPTEKYTDVEYDKPETRNAEFERIKNLILSNSVDKMNSGKVKNV